MALIYNNNGTWWCYLGKVDGKNLKASTKTRVEWPTADERKAKREEAEEIAVQLRREHRLQRHGLTTEPLEQPPTFAVFALSWEKEWGKLQRGYEGRLSYTVKELIEDFGPRRLTEITPELVHTWRTQQLEKRISPRTINRKVDVLKSILAKGVPRYYLVSPLHYMRRLSAAPVEVATLDRADEEKILAQLSEEDRAIFLLSLDGLVRLGDSLTLRWKDVMADGMVRITHSKNGKMYLAPLSSRAQAAIAALQPKDVDPDAPVFPQARAGRLGEKCWTDCYSHRFRDACKAAGVRYGRKVGGVTFHSATRHTGATRLVEAGTNIRVVQEIGGWASLQMLTRYTHPSKEVLKKAVEGIGGA